jgi:polysaccharide pyruvyl transferase WcaK-like protein
LESLLGSQGKKRILFSHDVGFALEPRAPQNLAGVEKLLQRRPGVPLVGVNVSGLLFIGGYSQSNMFGLRIDYPQFVNRLISFLIHECKALVLLVPHVYGETRGSESDLLASRTVFHQLKDEYGDHLRLVNQQYNESEVKFIIGRCDFFTGARMHACIAAVSQCVPAVPIAYSGKFIGVMRTINFDQYVADARKMDSDQILHLIQDTFDKRGKIRESLNATIPTVKQKTLGIFADFTDGSSTRY